MTVLEDVFGSLQHMTFLQLLLAFLACVGYAVLQANVFAARIRGVAFAVAALSAIGFVLTSTEWAYGVMLVAFAIGGLGAVAVIVWLLGQVLGLNGRVAPRAFDSAFSETSPESGVAAASTLANRTVAAVQLVTHSR